MRSNRWRWIAVAVLLSSLIATAGCIGNTPIVSDTGDGGSVPAYGLISPGDAVRMIVSSQDDSEFVLLDIRTSTEVEAGHISGASNLDFYSPTFRGELDQLDREKVYLIYCRTGNRTGQTRAIMAELGFEKVYDLDGGIRLWSNLDYPLCLGSLTEEHTCNGEYPEL